MQIRGDRILLRNIEEKDIEFLRQMINDKELNQMTVGESSYVSKIKQQIWFKNLKNEKKKIRFMIDTIEGTSGTIILENIDNKNKSASISIKIGKADFKGKGFGTETIKTILPYIFEELNLNRIYANVLEYNTPSKNMFMKCGFNIDGVQRQAIYKNEKFYDLIILSILRKDFNNNGK